MPVIVDAGVGTASDVAIAMELGAHGVLLNTGIASAREPLAHGGGDARRVPRGTATRSSPDASRASCTRTPARPSTDSSPAPRPHHRAAAVNALATIALLQENAPAAAAKPPLLQMSLLGLVLLAVTFAALPLVMRIVKHVAPPVEPVRVAVGPAARRARRAGVRRRRAAHGVAHPSRRGRPARRARAQRGDLRASAC